MNRLINLSINGDKDAYTNLILSIQNDLYRVAQARLSNLDDINDAIQETIINSYKSLSTLENPNYFKTWIIKILINECNMIYRKKNKQLGIFAKLSRKTTIITEKTEKEIQTVENNLDFEILIKNLDYEEKLIITLYYNNQYSISEIADILDMNINTTKSKFTRAKQKLKKMYDKGGIKNETKK